MLSSEQIYGNDLPNKTVCLTFDDGPGETQEMDGPGPRTLALAEFLASRSITATFFVIGERAANRRDIVRGVAEMNHLIGNHTYDHPDLCGKSADFAADQIIRTDCALIGVPISVKLFRAPGGSWDPKLAAQLNSTEARSYTGPVYWDICANDWRFWERRQGGQECADAYITEIRNVGRGIVLMHDSSFEDDFRSHSYTFDAAKLVVDWLQQNGFTFVGLDSIPQVRNALRVPPTNMH
jgi:peptidoglycan/xylan/chitin deacetylase (PgdA/CDA1 family)